MIILKVRSGRRMEEKIMNSLTVWLNRESDVCIIRKTWYLVSDDDDYEDDDDEDEDDYDDDMIMILKGDGDDNALWDRV